MSKHFDKLLESVKQADEVINPPASLTDAKVTTEGERRLDECANRLDEDATSFYTSAMAATDGDVEKSYSNTADECAQWASDIRETMVELKALRTELAASTAQYQSACDDAHRFAAELEVLRKRPNGIEFLFKWMFTANPMFGGISPLDMIRLGRGERVANFIQQAYEDRRSPSEAETKP